MAGLKIQVDNKLREFERLFQNKDFGGLEKRYTENCAFLPAGKNIHRGRKGISALIKSVIDDAQWDSITCKSEDFDASGELVVSVGSFQTRKSDGSVAAEGKYLQVYQKIGEELMLKYDTFNLNTA